MHRHPTQHDSHVTLQQREYPHGTRARYVGQRCRCSDCREANRVYAHQRARDPRIDAAPVRAHINALQSANVGLRSISDVADVPRVALQRIVNGQSRVLRSVANRVLSVDASVIADGALVPAQETRRLIRNLVREGYPKARLAKMLGLDAPALQYTRPQVTARTALRIRKLHDRLVAEGDDAPASLSMRERILAAIERYDSVTAEDLFDAMGIGSDNTAMQMLVRMAKSGKVERIGERPYRYRVPR